MTPEQRKELAKMQVEVLRAIQRIERAQQTGQVIDMSDVQDALLVLLKHYMYPNAY